MLRPLLKIVAILGVTLFIVGQGCPGTSDGDGNSNTGGNTTTNITITATSQPYGNGSGGAVTINTTRTLADPNVQYTSLTINTGITLTVPSGTVIRCTDTFTNNGTILVDFGAGGSRQTASTGMVDGSYAPAEAGVSIAPPSPGELGLTTEVRSGGFGGIGLSDAQARTILMPGVKAGGGSAGVFTPSEVGNGMLGGGGFTVLALAAVINDGTIDATGAAGDPGVGGSAGGVVVLASATRIAQRGTITVVGGAGGASTNFAGPGGGGGGGIVHLLAPLITSTGTISVGGGAAGTTGAANSVTLNPRQGGGGGGACAGDGGFGGNVDQLGTPEDASAGGAGISLQTVADPTAFFP